ncbi:DUF6578 domain-containing protein [Microbacterium terregens]|uniref:DUF6578 domain-containing protein n=1 Tax=Microbacterium terregens TaxID=69363 RepID=A0ABV5SYR6_9MICO
MWLADWEWECCGDPFAVGDDVDFGVVTRDPSSVLAETLGAALAATVDALESHHEAEFTDRVRGRVRAVHRVTYEVIERRTLRRPGHGAPPTAQMPANGAEWPMARHELGNGVFVGSRPFRYVIEVVPVPGSAALETVFGVRLPAPSQDGFAPSAADLTTDAPAERSSRSHIGWLVDIEEPERAEDRLSRPRSD